MSFDVDVSKRVGDSDIACRIAPGEGLTVLFGPSGAGKTSVLNMIAGLLVPDRGYVRVGGITAFDNTEGRDIDAGPELRCRYPHQTPLR